jgi:hypothetical protein
VKTAGGASEDRFDNVAVNEFGDLYLSGMARGNATFGSVPHESEGNAVYAFLTKISATPLATDNFTTPNHLKIYPNPVGDYFYLGHANGIIQGTISNALGQKVQSFETDVQGKVAVSKMANGVYYVKAGNEVVRFIKK